MEPKHKWGGADRNSSRLLAEHNTTQSYDAEGHDLGWNQESEAWKNK